VVRTFIVPEFPRQDRNTRENIFASNTTTNNQSSVRKSENRSITSRVNYFVQTKRTERLYVRAFKNNKNTRSFIFRVFFHSPSPRARVRSRSLHRSFTSRRPPDRVEKYTRRAYILRYIPVRGACPRDPRDPPLGNPVGVTAVVARSPRRDRTPDTGQPVARSANIAAYV